MRWLVPLFLALILGCVGREPTPTQDPYIPPVQIDEPDSGDSALDSAPPDCPDGDACDDGDLCTTGDVCTGGVCAGSAVDCDDDDACTTDTCDPVDGSCDNDFVSPSVDELYDLELLADPDTLAIEVVDTDTIEVDGAYFEVTELEFTSYQSHQCTISEVRLEAFIAQSASAAPGMVLVQDIDRHGDTTSTAQAAADSGLVVMMLSGPGEGFSHGTSATPEHLLDTTDDPRDSWLWEHSVATIRAITLFDAWPGVDRDRLGVSGHGYGGVAALNAAAVDERISVAVPVNASGHFEYAAAADARQRDWLDELGKDWESSKWVRFDRFLDPAEHLDQVGADTLVVCQAADAYFPLGGVVDTVQALPSGRVLVADDPDAWIPWAQGRWERVYALSELPDTPVVADGIELGSHGYQVVDVTAHWSTDGFETENTKDVSDLDWSVPEGSAGFVTVTYEGSTGQQFSLSSVPSLPEGYEPHIE